MATPTQPLQTGIQPSHISVTFTIVTPDQLRKIIFKLDKTRDSGSIDWAVSFRLDERADESKPFNMVIQLDVDVLQEDHDKAAATMKHGMDTDQHAQALAAGDTAKDAAATGAPEDREDAHEDAQAVITARNPASPQ